MAPDKFHVFGSIGTVSEFEGTDNWKLYQERLEQYFLTNAIEEGRKVPVLLSVVGLNTYKIIKDLSNPVLPKDRPYTEICELLNGHFSPTVPVFRKRIEFYNLRQGEVETCGNWYAKLKNAAIECKFGAKLNDVLKDKFVSGLRAGKVLDRLCEEDPETKTLKTMVELALKYESTFVNSIRDINVVNTYKGQNYKHNVDKRTSKDNKNMGNERATTTTTRAGKQEPSTTNKAACFACGRSNHKFSECRYKEFNCNLCKTKGHLAKVCKSRKSNYKVKSNNYVNSEETQKMDSLSMDFINMFSLNEVNFCKPFIIKMLVNGVPLEMELDTGAGVSVLPDNILKEKLSVYKVQPTLVKLKAYDGAIIEPIGAVEMFVDYKSIKIKCKFLIVSSDNKPLVGRDIMAEFGIGINNLVSVDSRKSKLDKLLDVFKDIFNEEIGTYNFEKINLKLKPDSSPVFAKPRTVPFAFKVKVEEELNRLEKEGVITLVDNNDWGTPLVPVLKNNGEIRICGDYKTTVNKFLEDVKHPLPKVEELFVTLQGGKTFSKIDFRNAYNQLVLDEETRKLLAWSTHIGIYLVNRLPYGTKPACAVFQKIVEKVLLGLKNTMNFLDDVIVTGATDEEHTDNLKAVFSRLKEAGFRVNLSKCSFFQKEVHYLGYIICAKGLKKDKSKIEAIRLAPRPQNVHEVRAFAGMVNLLKTYQV